MERTVERSGRWRCWVVFLAACVGGCGADIEELDEETRRELAACGKRPIERPVSPPPGTYVDQRIALDWDKLVPLPDATVGVDRRYTDATFRDPARMEQIYYEATHGNARAAWLVCVSEAALRGGGRWHANKLAGLACQTIRACSFAWGKLPWSRATASGRRMLGEMGRAFEERARKLQLERQLIGDALSIATGPRLAARVMARSVGAAPKVAAQPSTGGFKPSRFGPVRAMDGPRPIRLRAGRRTIVWKKYHPMDVVCKEGCEQVARAIQKRIGGKIGTIRPNGPPQLSVDGRSPGWAHHKVVVKDDRVYDLLTGPEGQPIAVYKARFVGSHPGTVWFSF